MAGRKDVEPGHGCREGETLSLQVVRPCPLCNELMEFDPQSNPQVVVCDSCGLACTIDLPPARPEVLELEVLPEAPAVAADGDDVVEWLRRAPGPIFPSPDFAAKQAAARRRQLALAGGVAGSAAVAIALLSGYFGYHRASDELAIQQQTAESREVESAQRLNAIQQRLERERQAADAQRLLAERDVRAVTSKYLAAQSQELATVEPWRSVIVSTDAIRSTLDPDGVVLPEAHQSLRDALLRCSASHDVDAIELRGHAGPITTLAVSPDGRWLATGSVDRTARLWDLQADHPQRTGIALNVHQKPVTSVLFSADGSTLLTGSRDATVCMWQLAGGTPAEIPIILPGKGQPISKMALSPDGRWLAAVSTEGGFETGLGQLWDLAAGPGSAVSRQLTGHAGQIQAMAMSPQSHWLALGVDDAVRLWDLTSRDPAAASVERQCRHGHVTATLFTGDGKWLVTCGDAREPAVRLWNLTSNDPSDSLLLNGLDGPVRAAVVSADSQYLVAAGNDSRLRVWNLRSSEADAAPCILVAGDAQLTGVTMSAAGNWLAASDAAGKVYLWRVAAAGVEPQDVVLTGGTKAIKALAFTPDGRWLAAAGDDWTARLWNLDIRELVAQADKLARVQIDVAALAARQPTLQESLLSLDPSDFTNATLPGALWSAIQAQAPRVQSGWKPWLIERLTLPEEPKIATGPRTNEVGAVTPPVLEEPEMPAAPEVTAEKPSLMVAMPEADPTPARPAVNHEWPVRSIVKRGNPAEAEPRTAAKPASTLEIHTR
ncbi:WD40 repeat domain-containing protein [Lacipirellula limnantheis]|uniref:WD domain, G-beta repeat n=1 Tax=Lacipirellula limnantheis TaxID=2528024 RepID=A0A517TUM4_9BACT|nr:hypothetical protein [Lacipirellula limnantheis]QDT72072.1 WD domain, G-beta repeat [Lacipirellula limnantheis]